MKLGFIGCGNMACAMIGGILKGGIAEPSQITGSCRTKDGCARASAAVPVAVTTDNAEVVRGADIVFLCVKPQFLDEVLAQIRPLIGEKLIVSIAAGRSIAYISEKLGNSDLRLIRLMPNTPALVGAGMTAGCCSEAVSGEEMETVGDLCRTFGLFEILPENLFDAVTGVSGSSPAYVFMFMEAMADAAVLAGMPRAQAYKFVGQAVLGSAKMMLDTGKHPGELKDMVTSPAGTTIEAVRVLEEKGLRSAVMEGTVACIKKSAQMNGSKD